MDNNKIENYEQSPSNNQISEIFTTEDNGFQAKKYFFTYHLQNDESFELAFKKLEGLQYHCEKFIWGEEYGKSGKTPHIQGAFILKYKMRALTIQNNFFTNTVHIMKLKNWNCAFNYCSKEGFKIITNVKLPEPTKILCNSQLFQWQISITKILDTGFIDDRKIYWLYGSQGCGKTSFMKYLVVKYNFIILNGSSSNMKNGIIEYVKKNNVYPKYICSNIGYDKDLNKISYSGYEDIKDMSFYSGKYEGGMICTNPCFLIIFANHQPMTTNKKFISVDITNAAGDIS